MVDTYQTKTGSRFGLERIDGERTDLKTLSSALLATPFLANSRLVVIEGLSNNKTVSAAANKLLEQVPASTVAVFYEPDIDLRTALYKSLSANAKVVKFDQLGPAQLAAWIKREVVNLDGQIDRPAINRLIELVGDDQWRLEQELIKLVNYQSEVTTQTMEILVESSFNQTIFDLVDAMSAGRTERALKVYRGLVGDQVNVHYILSMVMWQLRNLLLAKTAGALTPAELASQAKLSPYVAAKVLTAQRDFSEVVLRQAYLDSVETDFAIKSGEGEADQLVERLILKVAGMDAS